MTRLVFLGVLLVPAMVLAQASQAASQPVVAVGGFWTWMKANSWWVLPLGSNLLASIATALKNYPKGDGVAKVLWLFVAFLGNVEFKDGKRPGFVMKTPLTQAALPPTVAIPAATPAATPAPDADKPKE